MSYHLLSAFEAAQQTATPLDATAFAKQMRRFEKLVTADAPLAIAVSGGPDSTALALCLLRWAQARARPSRLIAFIVDHRLRPESAAEAQAVQAQFAQLGLETEILVWDHPPLHTRIHDEARRARYRLMAEACHRHGATVMAVAHQAEDQAETILERFAKGSGTDGLAGMAPCSPWEGYPTLRLIRPLLTIAKARLIATCNAAPVTFVQDPSNNAEKYARGRLRRLVPLLEAEGFTTARLTDLAARAQEDKEAFAALTDSFFKEHLHTAPGGILKLDPDAFALIPRGLADRVLDAALRRMAPRAYPLQRVKRSPVVEALQDPALFSGRSLGGVLISRTPRAIILIREAAAIQDRRPITAGETVIWDQRWHVTLDAAYGEKGLEVRKLGPQPQELVDSLAPRLRHDVPQSRARTALPALWQGTRLVAAPQLGPDLSVTFTTC